MVASCQVEVAGRHVLELQVAILGLGLGAVGHGLFGCLAGGVVLVGLRHVLGHVLAHGLERELVDVLGKQQHVVAAGQDAGHHGHLG